MGYQDVLEQTNCPTLRNRCVYLKMCTLYKIVHNLIYFPSNVVLPKHNSVVPTPLLHQPFARTNAFCSSFVLSAVSLWNNLPQEALAADSISSSNKLYYPFRAYSGYICRETFSFMMSVPAVNVLGT